MMQIKFNFNNFIFYGVRLPSSLAAVIGDNGWITCELCIIGIVNCQCAFYKLDVYKECVRSVGRLVSLWHNRLLKIAFCV